MLKNTIKKSLMNLSVPLQNINSYFISKQWEKRPFRSARKNSFSEYFGKLQNYVRGDIFFSKVARQKAKACKKSRPDY